MTTPVPDDSVLNQVFVSRKPTKKFNKALRTFNKRVTSIGQNVTRATGLTEGGSDEEYDQGAQSDQGIGYGYDSKFKIIHDSLQTDSEEEDSDDGYYEDTAGSDAKRPSPPPLLRPPRPQSSQASQHTRPASRAAPKAPHPNLYYSVARAHESNSKRPVLYINDGKGRHYEERRRRRKQLQDEYYSFEEDVARQRRRQNRQASQNPHQQWNTFIDTSHDQAEDEEDYFMFHHPEPSHLAPQDHPHHHHSHHDELEEDHQGPGDNQLPLPSPGQITDSLGVPNVHHSPGSHVSPPSPEASPGTTSTHIASTPRSQVSKLPTPPPSRPSLPSPAPSPDGVVATPGSGDRPTTVIAPPHSERASSSQEHPSDAAPPAGPAQSRGLFGKMSLFEEPTQPSKYSAKSLFSKMKKRKGDDHPLNHPLNEPFDPQAAQVTALSPANTPRPHSQPQHHPDPRVARSYTTPAPQHSESWSALPGPHSALALASMAGGNGTPQPPPHLALHHQERAQVPSMNGSHVTFVPTGTPSVARSRRSSKASPTKSRPSSVASKQSRQSRQSRVSEPPAAEPKDPGLEMYEYWLSAKDYVGSAVGGWFASWRPQQPQSPQETKEIPHESDQPSIRAASVPPPNPAGSTVSGAPSSPMHMEGERAMPADDMMYGSSDDEETKAQKRFRKTMKFFFQRNPEYFNRRKAAMMARASSSDNVMSSSASMMTMSDRQTIAPTIADPEPSPPIYSHFVAEFRNWARLSIVLKPIDALADMAPSLQNVVVLIELFVLMWILYQVSVIVQTVATAVRTLCMPVIIICRILGLGRK
uniref:ARAD1B09196p n=1 Tax=Blastobotrys adeninivorans TaxID=409370 RepID=A0A060T5Q6_BLAAD